MSSQFRQLNRRRPGIQHARLIRCIVWWTNNEGKRLHESLQTTAISANKFVTSLHQRGNTAIRFVKL